ncbi:molybdenum ABC transporter ATP-binding protein [Thalassobaculum salexigens]|uniref:molybdenum ABC transporter ATP-binding protein n=1 Tax=Thalassobaculum salexigens TaxID=455360 RepID=UPI00041A09DE|nr:molybdenum ABC transporter ATP-binding protein [Thalassobaculum salexigens]
MTSLSDRIDARFAGTMGGFSLDVAFTAPMQGITALFGPSGSGKTTVLRAMAGLARLSGRLAVGDETWQDDAAGLRVPPHRRAVGYVFQEASLFPHLSVRRNLLYGARRAADQTPVIGFDEAVALLGLERLLERGPDRLSGGERQRVAIGRALLSAPRLLLMDEPLSALDEASRADILTTFERLHDALPIPAIYVSHDLAEVSRLADRMVMLSAGKVIAEGDVGSILERLDLEPATGRFEAGVLLTAVVTGHDTGYQLTRLDLAGQPVSIPRVEVAVGERVRLRIRARDVALATRPPEGISIRNRLSGHIVEIAAAEDAPYAETLVEIPGGVRLRSRVTRESVAELGLTPGTRVYALVKTISFDGR